MTGEGGPGPAPGPADDGRAVPVGRDGHPAAVGAGQALSVVTAEGPPAARATASAPGYVGDSTRTGQPGKATARRVARVAGTPFAVTRRARS
ncbi:hypothetical protein [Streptomyces hebeiensis]|uniref:hypothetical protein n=1 Tax=Streptomyces hebeiensis TaxID=229486 RepID=UPI0031E0BAF4